jgi:hypothetical protein
VLHLFLEGALSSFLSLNLSLAAIEQLLLVALPFLGLALAFLSSLLHLGLQDRADFPLPSEKEVFLLLNLLHISLLKETGYFTPLIEWLMLDQRGVSSLSIG